MKNGWNKVLRPWATEGVRPPFSLQASPRVPGLSDDCANPCPCRWHCVNPHRRLVAWESCERAHLPLQKTGNPSLRAAALETVQLALSASLCEPCFLSSVHSGELCGLPRCMVELNLFRVVICFTQLCLPVELIGWPVACWTQPCRFSVYSL